MPTNVTNALSRQKATAEIISRNITKAQTSYAQSKDAAGIAAAHAYIVWVDTMSPRAHKDGRDWMDAQIAKRNNEITNHNNELKKLKKYAEQYKLGELASSNSFNGDAETKEEREQLAEDKATIIKAAAYTSQDWSALRKVPVDARDNSSMFTKIIKFVFEFEYASQASVVSRYAHVLDWIHAKFSDADIHDIAEITDAIKMAGGFEAALNEQRGKTVEQDNTCDKDREAIAEAIAGQVKSVIKTAKAKASFDMEVMNAPEGLVLMLGRYADGKVEIVGEMPMTDAELNATVSKFNDDQLLPTNDRVEFVARVMSLGKLVDEGHDSDIPEDGMKAGKKEKVQRALTCIPHAKSGVELMVSARFASASAIIKAVPYPDKFLLGAIKSPMMMPKEESQKLEKALLERSARRLLDLLPDVTNGELSWTLENSALMGKDSDNAQQNFTMQSLAAEVHKPLNISAFDEMFDVEITKDELRGLYESCLKVWKGLPADKKAGKKATLQFIDGQMTYQFSGEPDYSCAVDATGSVAETMQFRPKDLELLVKILLEQPVKEFSIIGDTDGLLCITWADTLGEYSVYLPTATKEGKLETRRIVPLKALSNKRKAA